jgi:Flp pilus assembly protein TadG
MRGGCFSNLTRFRRQERGGVAVEFAILLPVLLILLFGIVDFGHALYMKQIVTNASREAARYATRYHTDASAVRILPAQLTPSVADYVINTSAENAGNGGLGLSDLLNGDNPQLVMADLTSTTNSPGYSAADPAGLDITVTITAKKTWWVLGKLIPTLGTSKTVSATTVMKCE